MAEQQQQGPSMSEREFKRAQRIAMYGSNIPKSGQRAAFARAQDTAAKRAAAIEAGYTPPTAAATGDLLKRRLELFKGMQAAGPEKAADLYSEAEGLGISKSGFRQALNRITKEATIPPAGNTIPPAGNTIPPAGNTIPPLLRRPPSEGRINDMPASQAIAAVGKPAMFGKDIAEGNISKLGLAGAVADYRRRSAEEGKSAEPGNMEQLRLRDSGVTQKPSVGPLQTYLNEFIAEKETKEKEQRNAGIASSTLPALSTQGLRPFTPTTTTPVVPTPAPAPDVTPPTLAAGMTPPKVSTSTPSVKFTAPPISEDATVIDNFARLRREGYTQKQAADMLGLKDKKAPAWMEDSMAAKVYNFLNRY